MKKWFPGLLAVLALITAAVLTWRSQPQPDTNSKFNWQYKSGAITAYLTFESVEPSPTQWKETTIFHWGYNDHDRRPINIEVGDQIEKVATNKVTGKITLMDISNLVIATIPVKVSMPEKGNLRIESESGETIDFQHTTFTWEVTDPK